MIIDHFIKIYRTEEEARKTYARSPVSLVDGSRVKLSHAITQEALELDPDAIVYLWKNTVADHPGRRFWEDVLAIKGATVHLNEKDGVAVLANESISQHRAAKGKARLIKGNDKYICQRYHLHSKFGKVCYQQLGGDVPFKDPQPNATAAKAVEDKMWKMIDRLGDKLERIMEKHPLRKADYEWFDGEVTAVKKKMAPKIQASMSLVRINPHKKVGQKVPKAIPQGFVSIDEDTEMADAEVIGSPRRGLYKLLIPEARSSGADGSG
jgi:hypothetical protein